MLTSSTIEDYIRDYRPVWAFELPKEFFPKEILIAEEHPFFRLAYAPSSYDTRDFMSYAEMNPNRDWGERLPLAVGLSLIDNEAKARKNLKLPMFRQYKGIHYCPLKSVNISLNSLFTLHFWNQIALPTFEMRNYTPNLQFETFGKYDGVD